MRILLATAFALFTLPALAQDKPPAADPVNPDDVVSCVRTNPPLGSRGGWRKECHTKAEWKALDGYYAQSNRDFSDMTSRSGANNGALGGH